MGQLERVVLGFIGIHFQVGFWFPFADELGFQ